MRLGLFRLVLLVIPLASLANSGTACKPRNFNSAVKERAGAADSDAAKRVGEGLARVDERMSAISDGGATAKRAVIKSSLQELGLDGKSPLAAVDAVGQAEQTKGNGSYGSRDFNPFSGDVAEAAKDLKAAALEAKATTTTDFWVYEQVELPGGKLANVKARDRYYENLLAEVETGNVKKRSIADLSGKALAAQFADGLPRYRGMELKWNDDRLAVGWLNEERAKEAIAKGLDPDDVPGPVIEAKHGPLFPTQDFNQVMIKSVVESKRAELDSLLSQKSNPQKMMEIYEPFMKFKPGVVVDEQTIAKVKNDAIESFLKKVKSAPLTEEFKFGDDLRATLFDMSLVEKTLEGTDDAGLIKRARLLNSVGPNVMKLKAVDGKEGIMRVGKGYSVDDLTKLRSLDAAGLRREAEAIGDIVETALRSKDQRIVKVGADVVEALHTNVLDGLWSIMHYFNFRKLDLLYRMVYQRVARQFTQIISGVKYIVQFTIDSNTEVWVPGGVDQKGNVVYKQLLNPEFLPKGLNVLEIKFGGSFLKTALDLTKPPFVVGGKETSLLAFAKMAQRAQASSYSLGVNKGKNSRAFKSIALEAERAGLFKDPALLKSVDDPLLKASLNDSEAYRLLTEELKKSPDKQNEARKGMLILQSFTEEFKNKYLLKILKAAP